MKKNVFIAAVLGFSNVFVAMTQQKNSPIPLHNNGIETLQFMKLMARIIAIMVAEGLPPVL
ncbi:hypothetical protein ACIXR2_04240 [Bacteroides fragilis]